MSDTRPCTQCNGPQMAPDHLPGVTAHHHNYVPRSHTRAEVDALLAESEKAELAQRPAESAFWRDLTDSPHNPDEAAELGATEATDDPEHGSHLHPDDRRPNTRYVRAELADEDIPEPWLTLHAGGRVTMRARKGSASVEGGQWFWELTPKDLHRLHATTAMFLRMSGAEPDPGHPWFTGLAISGQDYAQLRRDLPEVLDNPGRPGAMRAGWDILIKLRALIEQNERRRATHDEPDPPRLVIEGAPYRVLADLARRWAPVANHEMWSVALQTMVRLRKLFAAQSRELDGPAAATPAPDVDPDSGP